MKKKEQSKKKKTRSEVSLIYSEEQEERHFLPVPVYLPVGMGTTAEPPETEVPQFPPTDAENRILL